MRKGSLCSRIALLPPRVSLSLEFPNFAPSPLSRRLLARRRHRNALFHLVRRFSSLPLRPSLFLFGIARASLRARVFLYILLYVLSASVCDLAPLSVPFIPPLSSRLRFQAHGQLLPNSHVFLDAAPRKRFNDPPYRHRIGTYVGT